MFGFNNNNQSVDETNDNERNRDLTNNNLTNRDLTNRDLTNNNLTNRDLTNRHLTNRKLDNVEVKIFTTGLLDSDAGNLVKNNTTLLTYQKIIQHILDRNPNIIITDIHHYDTPFNNDNDISYLRYIDNRFQPTVQVNTHINDRYIEKNDFYGISKENHIIIDLAHLFNDYLKNKLKIFVCYDNYFKIEEEVKLYNAIDEIHKIVQSRYEDTDLYKVNDIGFYEKYNGLEAKNNKVYYTEAEWSNLNMLQIKYQNIKDIFEKLKNKYEFDQECYLRNLNLIYIDWGTAKRNNEIDYDYRHVPNFIKIDQGKIIQDKSIKDIIRQLSSRR